MSAIDACLLAGSRRGVAEALGPRRPELSLPDLLRLTRHLRALPDEREPLRIGILRTYTTELLAPHWTFESLLQGFDLSLYEAPFGSLLQEAEPGSGLSGRDVEVLFLFLQREDLDPALTGPVSRLIGAERDEVLRSAVDRVVSLLRALRRVTRGLLVASWLPRFLPPELGSYDALAENSSIVFWALFQQRVAAAIRESAPHASFFDLGDFIEQHGRGRCLDPRLWYTSRFPFSVVGAQTLVRRLMAYPLLLKRPRAKCLVLDGDNTLWGGIVGEDGLEGLKLGHDYPGSPFLAFQRRLLEFQQRGILLALCSRNNESDVFEVLRDHPNQVLREAQFAAIRVNWLSKVDNLRSLAEELNLGLESFVFIDDSPHECESVRRALPEVAVVQVPSRLEEIPNCLDELPQLEILALTPEDRRRGAMYAADRRRRKLAAASEDPTSYLRSLEMVLTVHVDDRRLAPRIAQLTQKTNQFNLTTRRYSEAEIEALMCASDSWVAAFSLADVFGDSGLVGVAIVRNAGEGSAVIDSLLMSCRVIGRKAEIAFLDCVLEMCSRRKIRRVMAEYHETRKNALVRDFYSQNGFRKVKEGQYEIELPPARLAERPPIKVLSPPVSPDLTPAKAEKA